MREYHHEIKIHELDSESRYERASHGLAMDFIPFRVSEVFRILDLGCGTGNFLLEVLQRFPGSQCVAIDYSKHMLAKTMDKASAYGGRVEFHRRDLNRGLPKDLGNFDLVVSFSTIHHLHDEDKLRLFSQIHGLLEDRGWFFLIVYTVFCKIEIAYEVGHGVS